MAANRSSLSNCIFSCCPLVTCSPLLQIQYHTLSVQYFKDMNNGNTLYMRQWSDGQDLNKYMNQHIVAYIIELYIYYLINQHIIYYSIYINQYITLFISIGIPGELC